MDKYNELVNSVSSIKDDVTKAFEKGNFSASVRARKTLQLIRELALELRLELSKNRNK